MICLCSETSSQNDETRTQYRYGTDDDRCDDNGILSRIVVVFNGILDEYRLLLEIHSV